MKAVQRIMASVFLLAPFGDTPAQAQSWWALTYQPAQPLSNTQDFTNSFAWRGIGVDFKKQVKQNFTLGFAFGWQVFEEQTDEVVSAFGVDISGDQARYVNSFPILANGAYFFGQPGGLRPYLGANVGVYIMEHQLDIGLYSIRENNVHFGFGPEAGIALPLNVDLAVMLYSRYNYALSAGSIDDQAYVSFGAGFAWSEAF
jgi:hypothetical protein